MVTNLNENKDFPKACIIWMHGLGSNSKDMAALAEEPPLAELPLKHIFLNAPLRPVTINAGMMMPAWYDILGTSLMDREDSEGINASSERILKVIEEQKKEGFQEQQIFLAGFSQGGAMALYTGLTSKIPLAGIIVLSGYLPLASTITPTLPTNTPIFMAAGLYDHMVLPAWSKQVANYLSLHEYKHITLDEYPMEHAVCLEEIQDLTAWLSRVLQGAYV